MAATFDANATADVTANGVTSLTSANLTVGSGSNRALIVQLGFSVKTISALAVTWDFGASAQACAVVTGAAANATDNARAELWGLVAPVSGAKTLKAAWTTASDIYMNQTSWTGVDQTGGATSFPHGTSATGTSAAPSVTVTSAVGNATMACCCDAAASITAMTQTQTFNDNVAAGINAAGSRAAGAATVAHGYTIVSNPWVVVGCDLLASASASNPPPFVQWAPRNAVYRM